MTRELPDYSLYLPDDRRSDAWGVRLSAAGHTRIPAEAPYPPGRHPDDHTLTWGRGRVLRAYQLIHVTAGRGRFEADGFGRCRIEPGCVFLLFPGVWHRYEPLRSAGWTEDWIELQGPAVDRLRRAGVIAPAKCVYRRGPSPALEALFADCHHLVRAAPKGYQAVLGVLGLQILARALTPDRRPPPHDEVSDCVNALRVRLAETARQPKSMKDLADGSGVGYSQLRRAFKAHTGLTMKQYQMQVRLRQAQDQLLNTRLSVKEIAARLGFNSPFHFSADFKRQVGASPTQWRVKQARRPGSKAARH